MSRDIIQPGNAPDFAPLSNRGKVSAFQPVEDYSAADALTYWMPHSGQDYTASVDMVRLAYDIDPHGSPDIGEALADWWYNGTESDTIDYWPSVKPNQFQAVFTLYWGEWIEQDDGSAKFDKQNAVSLTAGAGYINADGSHDACKGFVEFNPNKVGQYALDTLLAFLRAFDARLELIRWDYAYDIPEPRSEVVMLKDQRKYECHISDSITTYLGARNSAGRVKVYDKQRESDLPVPVTRIEVTYARPLVGSGGVVLDPTHDYWPLVGRAASTNSAAPVRTAAGKALIASLLALVQLGQDVQPFLNLLEPDARSRYKRLLVPDPIRFNLTAWHWCAHFALLWEKPATLAALLLP